jgi:antitoxin component YwqK of YwqJK toxin-antitoxin module
MRFFSLILFICFVLFFNAGQAQSESSIESYVDYYESGVKYREGTVKDKTMAHGNWKIYYPSGKLQIEATYKDNILHGAYTSYFEDGTIESKGVCLNGLEHEKWFYGRVDSKEELTAEIYYEKGTACCYSTIFKNGQMFRVAELEDGKFKSIRTYVNSEKVKEILVIFDKNERIYDIRLIPMNGETKILMRDNLGEEKFLEISIPMEKYKNEFPINRKPKS